MRKFNGSVPARRARSTRGFTLIELMMVVVVVAILLAIAIPSYNSQVRKTRRATAKTTIMEIVQAKERFHTVNGTYAGSPCVDTSDHYAVTCPTGTATAFTIQAVPNTGSSQASDVCGTLGIDQTGLRTVSASTVANCW